MKYFEYKFRYLARAAFGLLFGLLLIAGPARPAEIPKKIPVESFARLPQVRLMQLAPDGRALAYVGIHEGRGVLVVHDMAARKAYQMATPERSEIGWFAWVNDQYLIVSYNFTSRRRATNTKERRLFAVSRALDWSDNLYRPHALSLAREKGGDVGNEIQFQDDVIDMLPDDPDHFLMAINADRDWERKWEVRKVEVATGDYETITEGVIGIQNWVTDRSHELRYGWGFKSGLDERRVIYRNPETGKWTDVQDSDWYERGARIVAFADNPRHAYLRSPNDEGRYELVLFDMIAEEKIETVFSHEKFDAGGLLYKPNGREADGKPIGYTYSGENGAVYSYFDPEFAEVHDLLSEALPGGYNLVVSALSDRKQYIIYHGSDVDAGRYFLLDMNASQLSPLFRQMPGLDPAQMAPMRTVSYLARDGTGIPAFLTLPVGRGEKNLPLVVMPHGGPHARDTKGFHYRVQFLANRGYAVLQPNFRGSTGYGRAFRQAGIKQWGGLMQDDVTDGARWLIEQGIADPARVCILGASYGGYAALAGAALTPDLYRCAVSINGVSDLVAMNADNKKYIGGRQWEKSIGMEGEKLKAVSPRHMADRITIPVLLIAARDDRTVNPKQSRLMHKALKKVGNKSELVELSDGGHGLRTEDSRIGTLRAIEAFLLKHLGPG